MLDITVVGKVCAFKIAVSEALAASTDVLVRLVGISAASSNDDEVAIWLGMPSWSRSGEIVVGVTSGVDVLVWKLNVVGLGSSTFATVEASLLAVAGEESESTTVSDVGKGVSVSVSDTSAGVSVGSLVAEESREGNTEAVGSVMDES